jgi:NAD(P)H-quinone oxidoreductase subunit 5
VLLLGVARVWLQRRGRHALTTAVILSAVVLVSYGTEQAIFARLIGDLVAPPAPLNGASVATAVGVVALMTGLVCVQLGAPGSAGSAAWARAYAIVSNGFYLNTIANRWVLRLWPAAPSHAHESGAAA